MSLTKLHQRIQRLSDKVSMSKTPVPGFVVGLSGTDSIVAFLACYDALLDHGKADKMIGIHYVNNRVGKTWFESYVFDWLKRRCPEARIDSRVPDSGSNEEADRWHDLNANYRDTHWIVGAVNATEKALGTYSIFNKSASVWPIATLWKSDIINICEDLNAPQIVIDKSKIPDCACGRDELAAENIELIDQILQFKVDPTKHDPELLNTLMQWITSTKQLYDFKERTPYMI